MFNHKKRKLCPELPVQKESSCWCKPGLTIGPQCIMEMLSLLQSMQSMQSMQTKESMQSMQSMQTKESLMQSLPCPPASPIKYALQPHHDAQLLLASLTDSKIKYNVQIATSMPACVNPFLECEHDQVIKLDDARRWFRLLGYTG